MKKILFVTNHLQYSDGVARALLNLVNNLDKTQYDISVCAIFRKDEKFIQQFNKNIKVFSVFNRYFKGLYKLLKFVPKRFIINKVIREKYDIVIAYQRGYPTELLAHSRVSMPKIAFMHGYDTESIKYHKNYNKIICVAESSAIDYKEIVDFADKVTYCHNVLEVEDIKEKSQDTVDIAKDFELMKKPILTFVGRLSKEKGIERTLNSLAKLRDENLGFTYVIVGDGPMREEVEGQIQRLKLDRVVKMYGFQKNPYKYLSLSNACICNSYTEGLNTACIESSILGLDILSTDVSGAKEIVLNPDVGLVCKNNDEAIYNCLKDYIVNKYPNDMWADNKEPAKQKWQKESVVKKFNDIVSEVLK